MKDDSNRRPGWSGRPTEFSIHCTRCGGHAIFDEPFDFYPERKGLPLAEGRPVHRWGGRFVVEKYPSILPWVPPKGYQQALSSHVAEEGSGVYVMHRTGVMKCTDCHRVAVHALQWPTDAYYQWNIRGHILWAWSREHAQVLLDYLGGTERDPNKILWWRVSKLPQAVIAAKVRDNVVKQITRTLLEDTAPN